MILQQSPNRWSCLPTAFATALGVQVHDFIRHIGHDGSEIIWPILREPTCRRGFHVQECIDVVNRIGFSVTPFEVFPRHAPAFTVPAFTIVYGGTNEAAFKRFTQIIDRGRGVITGHSNTVGHAIAYDHGFVCDPVGLWYRYSPQQCEAYNFVGHCAWEIHAISQ